MTDNAESELEVLAPTNRESEFKFFRLLEDTLVGSIAFVIKFIYTTWLVFRHPHRFAKSAVESTQRPSLTRPFTYLAVSAFAASRLLVFAVGNLLLFFRNLFGTEESPPPFLTLHYQIESVSLLHIVATALPCVFLVFLFALITAKLVLRKEAKHHRPPLIRLACYATGYQFILLALLLPLFFSLEHLAQYAEWVALVALALYLFYLLTIPVPLYRSALREFVPTLTGIRRGSLVVIGSLLISIFLLVGSATLAVIPSQVLLDVQSSAEKLRATVVGHTADENGDLNILLLLQNVSQKTIVIGKTGRLDLKSSTGENTYESELLEIVRWSANDELVMIFEKGETQWILCAARYAGTLPLSTSDEYYRLRGSLLLPVAGDKHTSCDLGTFLDPGIERVVADAIESLFFGGDQVSFEDIATEENEPVRNSERESLEPDPRSQLSDPVQTSELGVQSENQESQPHLANPLLRKSSDTIAHDSNEEYKSTVGSVAEARPSVRRSIADERQEVARAGKGVPKDEAIGIANESRWPANARRAFQDDDLMPEYVRLREIVDTAAEDVYAARRGNKAAGIRVRKAMQEAKEAAQSVRKRVLELWATALIGTSDLFHASLPALVFLRSDHGTLELIEELERRYAGRIQLKAIEGDRGTELCKQLDLKENSAAIIVRNRRVVREFASLRRRHLVAAIDEILGTGVGEKVFRIVSKLSSEDQSELSMDLSFVDDLNWHSLLLVDLVIELEDEFHIPIPDEAVEELQTIGQAVGYIENRLMARE